LITWNASGVAAAVAVGSDGQVLTSGGAGVAPTFEAASAGAVTREGGNTTEATTASFTAVDLFSITSLTPAVTKDLMIPISVRASQPGAAAKTAVGLKVGFDGGDTIVMEADIARSSYGQVGSVWAADDNVARVGLSLLMLGSQVTNYLGGIISGYASNQLGGGGSAQSSWSRGQNFENNMPLEALTSVILRGEGQDVTNPDPTLGIDQVHVYSLSTS
jgi:hypothetical protein